MIYIVDQNVMRSDLLRARMSDEPDCSFVIPDTALVEMTKSDRWEDTLRRSFEILAPALDRTFFAASLDELLNHERSARTPVGPKQILPDDLTPGMRGIVRAVLDGGEGIGELRKRFEHSRLAVQSERSTGDDLKSKMLDNVGRLATINGQHLVGDIRSGRMSPEARLGLLKLRAERIMPEFVGFDAPRNGAFRLSDLITTRFIYARLWYQEFWLFMGGLEAVQPKRVANDDFDMEYALIASFYDGLLSNDKTAVACAAALRAQPEKS